MDTITEFFRGHLPFILEHKYILFLILASLEGFNSFIIAGFLISIGTFAFWPAFGIAVLGETLSGTFWYGIGYWFGARPIDWFTRNSPSKQRLIARVREYCAQYTVRVLMAAKLTYSVTIATLILVGSLKYPFKRFSLLNFAGSIGWALITFAIGAFFGKGYQLYLPYIRGISNAILFIVVSLVLLSALQWSSRTIFVGAFAFLEKIRLIGARARAFFGGEDRVE